MNTATLVVTIYLSLFIALGFYLNKKNASGSDWAIGGGTLTLFMLVAGIAGTRIGGVGTYGVTGDVIADGIGHFWFGANLFSALLLVGLFYAIPYRRLKVISVGQVFERRFGSYRCQWLTSLCIQTEYLIINIIEPYVIGLIINGLTGIPLVIGIIIGGLLIIGFTVTGGMKGIAATNIIHCFVIFFGLLFVGLVAMQNMGGWNEVINQVTIKLAESGKDDVTWWSFTGIGIATLIALFISATVHTPSVSIYANMANSVEKESYLIKGFIMAGIFCCLVAWIAGFIGILTMAAYGSDGGLSGYRNITQLAVDTGPVLGGIALAAVVAAVISTGAPVLLASATMFVNDWLPSVKKLNGKKQLRAYKTIAVVYGLIGVFIACLGYIGSILKLLLLAYAFVVPPAVAVTFVIYWRRTSECAVFWGIALGFSSGMIMWLLNTLFDGIENATAGGFAQWWYELIFFLKAWSDPSFLTLLVPIIVIPLVSLLYPNKAFDYKQCIVFYKKLGRIHRNFSWF